MNIAVCVLLSFMLLFVAAVQGKNTIHLYHEASKKYIGEYKGYTDRIVYLVPTVDKAQLFTIKLNEVGFIQINTHPGGLYMDKTHGCNSEKPDIIYFEFSKGDHQFFSFNNDNTIGSRCCETCLLTSNEDNTKVIMKKRSNETDDKDFVFKVLPGEEINDVEIY